MYFRYSGHYLEPEISAFERISAALEKKQMTKDGRKPTPMELATLLYMYAHCCTREEAEESCRLQTKVITEYYGKEPTEDEILEAFVLASTAELIATGEVPYAQGRRVLSPYYHPVAIADCNGMDQGTPEEQAKWRGLRQHYGIGGSENAALHGVSHWANNVSVYKSKMGEEHTKNDLDASTQFMFDIGHVSEQPIADYFAAIHGVKVRNDTIMYRHPYYPWMIADLDRRTTMRDKDGSPYEALIEIKTASYQKKDEWAGSLVPIYYVYQCRHYMAVMNVNNTFIVCHFGGGMASDIVTRKISRIRGQEEALIETLKDFWLGNILTQTPPVPNGPGVVQSRVSYYYSKLADKNRPQIPIESSYKPLLEELLALKDKKAQAKKDMDAIDDEIKAKEIALIDRMGAATEGVCDNDDKSFFQITYKPNSTETVEKEGLRIAYPEVYAQYVKTKAESSRTMRISVKKKTKGFVMPSGN